MATKAELIGEVLLRLSGGVLTSDQSVRWPEAEVYLAMAVNYVQTLNYWNETKAEGERTVNPTLLQSFDDIDVLYSTDRQQSYSDLPKRVLSLPKGRALQLNTKCGKRIIPLGEGDDATEQYYKCFKSVISYQLEGQKVWYYGMSRLVEGVRGKYLVHVNDLADDDEVLLPSDGDAKVLDMMYGWLSGEKEAPKDYLVDAKDN